MEDTPDNLVKFPMTRAMRFRHSVNKAKDALGVAPEMVTYKKSSEPVAGALDEHLTTAQNTTEYKEMSRPEHFETGQQEATVHNINEGRELQRIRGNSNE